MSQGTLNDSLQLWLPLDGNGADASSNAITTNVHGTSPGSDRFDNPNGALYFDGDDWINTGTSFDYEHRTGAAWSYIQDTSAHRIIFTQDAHTLQYGSIYLYFITTLPKWSANAGGNSVSARGHLGNYMPYEEWIHTAAIRDGNMNYYYRNGILVDSAQSSSEGSFSGANPNLVVGTARTTTDRFWLGKLDGIRIYNRALKAWEVWNLYCPADAAIKVTPLGNGLFQAMNDSVFAASSHSWYFDGTLISDSNTCEFRCDPHFSHELVLVNTDGFCIATDTFQIEPGCGMEPPLGAVDIASQNISIYPNPAEDIVYLSSGNNERNIGAVTLFNALGQKVGETSIYHPKGSLTLKGIDPGIYYIQVLDTYSTIIKE
jgi:hypothetical protein